MQNSPSRRRARSAEMTRPHGYRVVSDSTAQPMTMHQLPLGSAAVWARTRAKQPVQDASIGMGHCAAGLSALLPALTYRPAALMKLKSPKSPSAPAPRSGDSKVGDYLRVQKLGLEP